MTVAPDPAPDDESTFTRGLVIGALVAIVAVSLLAYFSHWHWLGSLWFGYTWPSLKGNGPEALVQTIAYGAIAVLVIPPVRKWFVAKFHRVHQTLEAHHADAEQGRAELHRKLSHIIEHSSEIPNETRDGVSLIHPPPPKESP